MVLASMKTKNFILCARVQVALPGLWCRLLSAGTLGSPASPALNSFLIWAKLTKPLSKWNCWWHDTEGTGWDRCHLEISCWSLTWMCSLHICSQVKGAGAGQDHKKLHESLGEPVDPSAKETTKYLFKSILHLAKKLHVSVCPVFWHPLTGYPPDLSTSPLNGCEIHCAAALGWVYG